MSKVVFRLQNGTDGEVILRDCAFTDWWKHVFRLNSKRGIRPERRRYYARSNDQDQILALKRTHIPDFVAEEERAVQLISSGISEITALDMPWSRSMPRMGMDYAQLNDIHRGFTTLSLTICTDRVDLSHDTKCDMINKMYNFHIPHGREFLLQYSNNNSPWEFPLDNLHEVRSSFMHSIHKINSGVHNIEDRVRVSQREIDIHASVYPGNTQVCMPLLDWNSKDPGDDRTDIYKVDYNLADVAYWCHDDDPQWNVYDLKNILGKDYLTAYYNYDDPGEWDVCNHYKTTKGGFDILPYMHSVVHNTLIPWMHSLGYPAWPDVVSPIPIGRVDEAWITEFCCTGPNAERSVQGNWIVEVDLIE